LQNPLGFTTAIAYFSVRYENMTRQFPVQSDSGILNLDNNASRQTGNHGNGAADGKTKGFQPFFKGIAAVYPIDRNGGPVP
jgi:hypothetical protein